MKRIAILLITALALVTVSCSESGRALSADGYQNWLCSSLSLPDSLACPEQYWHDIVANTLETRERMDWGIPEREFRHFVLPVRVNNEDLDNFRLLYSDELCSRVEGLSMYDAILEINHWCHEHVTYIGTDFRTRGPLALMATGEGRCGEESTFTVSALRAAGIPARQVYTPRWAHTDDNHAWVEAWADGSWYFLGACEPAPTLNWGWFNESVARALLLHTKVVGDYRGDEDVIARNPVFTEINVIRNYVNTRKNTVTVLRADGTPVEGARVEYKIFNYQEFCTVCSTVTDADGRTSLYSGIGDMLVWAAAEGGFGFAKLDRENVTIVLDRAEGDSFDMDVNIIPPQDAPIPTHATEEEIAECDRRMAAEDSIRNAAHTVLACKDILDAFLADAASDPGRLARARTVVDGLSKKDSQQMSREVLDDAMAADGDDPYVLAPRIEFEMLHPYKAEIRAGLEGRIADPRALESWVRDSVKVVSGRNPQRLRIPPVYVWRSRIADETSLKIFFVAACRALGFPARYEYATGKAQWREDGQWCDANFGEAAAAPVRKGQVRILCEGKVPEYFVDYTIARIDDGRTRLLDFEYGGPEMQDGNMVLDEGHYMVTSGTRLPDGSVLAHINTFTVLPDQVNDARVVLRDAAQAPLDNLGTIDASKVCGADKFILAIVKENGEPTMHALRQLEGNDNAVIVAPGDSGYAGLKEMVERATGAGPDKLPYVIVADKTGRVYYLSQGYNTVLKESVARIFDRIKL